MRNKLEDGDPIITDVYFAQWVEEMVKVASVDC